MRLMCLLFLVAVGAGIAYFAVQNQQPITLTFLDRAVTAPVVAILGVAYALGMVTGWSVIGVLRRSLRTATEYRSEEPAAR